MASYYDYVLVVIPLALFAGAMVSLISGITLTVAIPAGGLLSVAVISHALFVRAPTSVPEAMTSETETTSSHTDFSTHGD